MDSIVYSVKKQYRETEPIKGCIWAILQNWCKLLSHNQKNTFKKHLSIQILDETNNNISNISKLNMYKIIIYWVLSIGRWLSLTPKFQLMEMILKMIWYWEWYWNNFRFFFHWCFKKYSWSQKFTYTLQNLAQCKLFHQNKDHTKFMLLFI